MAGSVSIECKAGAGPIAKKAVEIFRRTVRERSGLRVTTRRPGECRVALHVAEGIGADGFRIDQAADGAVTITGNDPRGLLYGVGRFLRDSRFGRKDFTPGAWRGVSVPVKPVRGMYFASHFHNFYHDAPVEQVQRYVEELALWGCNALSVWFDMHHFAGIDDPEAQAMIARLRAILEAANRVGIGAGLTTLANEAYGTSPQALRADWTAGHDGYTSPPGGHYHVEICPSKPGGLDLILQWRREMLQAFADLDIRFVWIWPYDQGGCTCSQCAPWGANGFLRTAQAEAKVIREVCPQAKVVLSTWYFDHFTTGEWNGITKAFGGGAPDWADYLLADDYSGFPEYPLKHGSPGGLPMVHFAEISMCGMWPWGGYGANPRPAHWQEHWDKTRDLLQGGFPYSEGIFEDINKVFFFQFGWDPGRKATDILREYASYEFSPEAADDVIRAAELMERGLYHGLKSPLPDLLYKPRPDIYFLGKTENAQPCFEIIRAADAKLPPWARRAWRWRIFYLRAALDDQLRRSKGKASKKTERWFGELNAIYHAAHTEYQMVAPSVEALKRVFAEGLKQT